VQTPGIETTQISVAEGDEHFEHFSERVARFQRAVELSRTTRGSTPGGEAGLFVAFSD
jgi:hypothetical protein